MQRTRTENRGKRAEKKAVCQKKRNDRKLWYCSSTRLCGQETSQKKK